MKKFFSLAIAAAFALSYATAIAQNSISALVPMPNSITQSSKGETFQVNSKTTINSSLPQGSFLIEGLKQIIENRTGIALTEEGDSKRNRIELVIDNTLKGKEHYTLKVDKKGISIKGSTEGALFWGLKTLDQLLIGDICNTAEQRIEHIYIDDNPRYGYRAVMIDPARHFLPVKDVKFFIDQMARFKFNVLQLHLTDDQG